MHGANLRWGQLVPQLDDDIRVVFHLQKGQLSADSSISAPLRNAQRSYLCLFRWCHVNDVGHNAVFGKCPAGDRKDSVSLGYRAVRSCPWTAMAGKERICLTFSSPDLARQKSDSAEQTSVHSRHSLSSRATRYPR